MSDWIAGYGPKVVSPGYNMCGCICTQISRDIQFVSSTVELYKIKSNV